MSEELEKVEETPKIEPTEETKEPSGTAEEGGEEEVVFFADEEPPKEEEPGNAQESSVIRELRRKVKEEERARKAAEAKLAEKQNPPVVELLPDPPLLDPAEYDYDLQSDKYKADAAARDKEVVRVAEHNRKVNEKAEKAKTEAEEVNKVWNEKEERFLKARTEVRMPDFADAEATVYSTLSGMQVKMLVRVAASPEKLMYALGRNEAKLKALAALKDPVDVAFAVRDMETMLKTKRPPPAESKIPGSAPTGGGYEKELEKLEAEADRTGDRTKVIAFKRSNRK